MIQNFYLFGNYIITASGISWIVAQLIKTVINTVINRKMNFERLIGAGGMPSSHSAMMSSLFVAVGRKEGMDSTFFAIAFLLAMVVMYDAMGVRRATGEHAKLLNFIVSSDIFESTIEVVPPRELRRIRKLQKESSRQQKLQEAFPLGEVKESDSVQMRSLKEFVGHTPLEVICGSILGMTIAFLLPI